MGARAGARITKLEYEGLTGGRPRLLQNLLLEWAFSPSF